MTEAEKFLKQSGCYPFIYLNAFRRFPIDLETSLEVKKFMELPVEERVKKEIDHFKLRHEFIEKFGFAILAEGAIEVIKKYQPLIECGAGSGYWSYECQKRGIDIIATDPGTGRYWHRDEDKPRAERTGKNWEHKYTTVEQLTARRALKKYPDRNLLTVWPDYGDGWTTGMLNAFKGKYVIYVGEQGGGCTGSDMFHEILEDEYDQVDGFDIPQFDGIHDTLAVYSRKEVSSLGGKEVNNA